MKWKFTNLQNFHFVHISREITKNMESIKAKWETWNIVKVKIT